MKLSQFNFKLPKDQVALYPHKARRVVKTASGERVFEVTRRDESRLMVLHKKSETIEMYKKDEDGKDMVDADGNPVYLQFKDIVNYFTEGDTFVFFDTMVICKITALSVILSGNWTDGTNGGTLALSAFASGFGKFGSILLAVIMDFFSVTTTAGWLPS